MNLPITILGSIPEKFGKIVGDAGGQTWYVTDEAVRELRNHINEPFIVAKGHLDIVIPILNLKAGPFKPTMNIETIQLQRLIGSNDADVEWEVVCAYDKRNGNWYVQDGSFRSDHPL